MIKNWKKTFIYLFLLSYLVINVFFLTEFPFVHSDESWLGGLSRNIMYSHNIFSTESFFNLYPRNPHSIKILFHLLQIPFIKFFGYNIFSLRLISLLFSILSIFMFYKILSKNSDNLILPILNTLLLSLNIQFIYASHFARQEIIILFLLLLGLFVYIYYSDTKLKYTVILGSTIGIGIGIHPNSFILALVFGLLYLYDWIKHKKTIKHLNILIITTAFYAGFFVLLSFIGDRNFISHYKNFGSAFGVNLPFYGKLLNFKLFYMKIYYSISGTYYVPSMKYFWNTFIIIIFISIVILLIKFFDNRLSHKLEQTSLIEVSIISIMAVNFGILLIGRFNATSIVFIIPFYYLLLHNIIFILFKNKNKIKLGFYLILIFISLILCIFEIKPYLKYNYNNFLEEFSNYIPKNAKTLGNLNSEFYFENNALLDYRNLAFLDSSNVSFEDYVETNNIEYIIYYEELDYIHNNPKWLILYGDDNYYDEMQEFIANKCRLVHSFYDPLYGVRISRYMMDYNWEIKIYEVK